MIERIFHPIGQGAFYSERHENFNIVYDCGNWKNTNVASKVVKQAFSKGEDINILFISHFDYDHVNKIETLKEHTKIKNVIIPLLHDNEKILLRNLYRVLEFNILTTLIEDPKKFFGEDTQIIQVDFGEFPIGDNNIIIDLDTLDTTTNKKIQSGTILKKKFNIDNEWVFIPYNYKYQERNSILEDLLSEEGLNVDKLKTDPEYTLTKNSISRKKIHDIYDKLSGRINRNSMLLYSGPNCESGNEQKAFNMIKYYNSRNINVVFELTLETRKRFCNLIDYGQKLSKRNKTGCIYTGDADLKDVNLKDVFRKCWKNVGTVQIPHHGSKKSFDESIFEDRNENKDDDGFYCPISVGEKNSYGHPSYDVISKILCRGSIPILVTENLSSGFIECIKYE